MSNRKTGLSIARAGLSALSLLVAASALSGCNLPAPADNEQEAAEYGQLELALTASTPSGAEYKLRDATFLVTAESSGEVTTISTEADPGASTITLSLEEDFYLVELQEGYWLERTASGGSDMDAGVVGPVVGSLARALTMGVGVGSTRSRWQRTEAVPAARAAMTPSLGESRGAEELGPVESQLISPNPTYVEVISGESTNLEFAFRVGGESTGGLGELEISIYVEEASLCMADAYEPNDTPDTASAVMFPFDAMACSGNDDFYAFPSPVESGKPFAVTVEFLNSQGDLDALLVNDQLEIVAEGISETDNETLSAVSDGGDYLLYVYPWSGEAPYAVSLETDFGEQSDCCSVSGAPGCTNVEVQECVCAIDSVCCSSGFDELCVEEAQAECGQVCEAPAADSDCCQAGDNPGCTEPSIEQCVCDMDPFCCAAPFDENCVDLAIGVCDAACGEGS